MIQLAPFFDLEIQSIKYTLLPQCVIVCLHVAQHLTEALIATMNQDFQFHVCSR